MVGRQADAFIVKKDARPFAFGVVEQVLDRRLQLRRCVLIAESQGIAQPVRIHLVIKLGKDQLEDFLEDIDPGIGQNLVFHVLDQVAQGAGELAFLHTLFLKVNQGLDGPGLIHDLFNGLICTGQFMDRHKIVGVLAVPDFGQDAVTPHGKGCPGRVGIGPQLFLAVLILSLLNLDDDVGDGRAVGVEHHDVSPLGTVAPKGDRVFDGNARPGVAKLVDQASEPKLAGTFLGLELHFLVADEACHIRHLLAPRITQNYSGIKRSNLFF